MLVITSVLLYSLIKAWFIINFTSILFFLHYSLGTFTSVQSLKEKLHLKSKLSIAGNITGHNVVEGALDVRGNSEGEKCVVLLPGVQ